MKLTAQKTEISTIEDYISTDYNPLFAFLMKIYMFDFYLPLEDYFVKILLENKIQNWEAKLFWLNIEHLNQLEEALLHKDLKCKAPLIDPNLRRNLGKWAT